MRNEFFQLIIFFFLITSISCSQTESGASSVFNISNYCGDETGNGDSIAVPAIESIVRIKLAEKFFFQPMILYKIRGVRILAEPVNISFKSGNNPIGMV